MRLRLVLALALALIAPARAAELSLSQLPAATSLATTDLIPVTINPGSTPASRKATIATLFDLLDGATMTFTNKSLSWGQVTGTPTTVSGYGIVDALSASGAATLTNKTISGASNTLSNIAWSSLVSTPTTLAGYGISDAITSAAVAAGYQPLDSDLTSIAGVITTSFGRGLLTELDASSLRSTLGLGDLATLSAVGSSQITDGTIVNADINASAAIALSKLATDPLARANHTGTQTMSTISDAGALATLGAVGSSQITDGSIVNADINASAAIALSKLATDPLARANHTGTQTMSTISDAGSLATLSAVGSSQITDGTIVNADINASAAIALSKLATDPLARANHTGTQAWSTLTSTPTTLAGYGISDAVSTSTLSAWTGTTNVTTLGTVTTGTWSATAIGTSKGGAPSGGSTGQVLTKSSNTSYDYAWATPSGGGGGTAIDIDGAAWVEADGNDTTGTIGDPARPYLTMSEAYDDGARTFFVGAGTFAGLSKSGAITVWVMGLGRNVSTITIIESTNSGAISVDDLGVQTVTVTTVGRDGASGAESEPGVQASEVALKNVYVGTIQVNGGGGGASDETVDMVGAGAGGAGGTVNLKARCTVGTINQSGGPGGSSADLAAGNGGSGGSLSIRGGSEVTNVVATGGAGGTASGMGTHGEGSSGSSPYVYESVVGSMDISGGNGASVTGAGGSLTGRHCLITNHTSGGELTSTTISGSFIQIDSLTGGGTVNAVISRINGTTY